MFKMNPEVKALWVAALRSGKYKQAKGKLHDREGRMCCLGVLCDLCAHAHPEYRNMQWKDNGLSDAWAFGPTYETGLPPSFVYEWAGVEREVDHPKLTIRGVTAEPQNLNDGKGDNIPKDFVPATFEEIADAVEAQW